MGYSVVQWNSNPWIWKRFESSEQIESIGICCNAHEFTPRIIWKDELLGLLQTRSGEILDWAYEEEEKEVKPDECECFSCQDLIDRIEKAYIEMQEKELEKEFRELIKKYTDLIK